MADFLAGVRADGDAGGVAFDEFPLHGADVRRRFSTDAAAAERAGAEARARIKESAKRDGMGMRKQEAYTNSRRCLTP